MTNLDSNKGELENFKFLTRNISCSANGKDIFYLNAGTGVITKEDNSPNHYRVDFEGVPFPVKVRRMYFSRTKSEKIIASYDAAVESIHSD